MNDTYLERRVRLEDLMVKAALLIRDAPPSDRALLIARCTDSLMDCLEDEVVEATEQMRLDFVQACRDFWMRDNSLHSVKAPGLRLVR